MRPYPLLAPLALALVSALPLAVGCGGSGDTASATMTTTSGSGGAGGGFPVPVWLSDARILVNGGIVENDDCRKGICRHNENTDLVTFHGDIYLVHRTAHSQVLGPNSSLHIYRSKDSGASFTETGVILAPVDRDLRDPHFYIVGETLFIKALTRLPVNSTRDSNVDTIAMISSSADGATWSDLSAITPKTWSLWRIKESKGIFYSAAYEDGDKSVWLFTSPDGKVWTKGAPIYTLSVDTPLETELTFLPSGKILALVRMDGTDGEILGDEGRHRTKVCRSDAPYAAFDCPTEIGDQRLDGPLSFFHEERLFVVARKHLGANDRKRTALFEIKGDLESGPLTAAEIGELPSAADTSYAGVATVDATRSLVTWYSGNIDKDEGWAFGLFDTTDIWQGTIDFSKIP
ncbi:MAG: sialidase family protein [Byssovorax sp.]